MGAIRIKAHCNFFQFFKRIDKMKMMSRKNARKVWKEQKFVFANCGKSIGSSSILCQFCMSCLHKSSSGIRDRLKQDDDFEGRTSKIQEIDTLEELPDIEFSAEPLEFVKKFFVLVTSQELDGVLLTEFQQDEIMDRVNLCIYYYLSFLADVCRQELNADYSLLVVEPLCYMRVKLGQLKMAMRSDHREMMKGYLDGCAIINQSR